MNYNFAYQKALIQAGSVKVAKNERELFTLRSGKLSWLYIDHGDLLCQPETNVPYVKALDHFIQTNFPHKTTVLVNVDSKSSPHTTGALAILGNYRQIVVSSKATQQAEKGTNRGTRLPHDLKNISDIVLIDDVLASGLTAMTVAQDIQKEIKQFMSENELKKIHFHLVVGLAKAKAEETATNLKKHYGVTIHWLITLKELLTLMSDELTVEQREGIKKEFPEVVSS